MYPAWAAYAFGPRRPSFLFLALWLSSHHFWLHGVRHMFAEPTWDPKLIVSKTSNLMLETWSYHFCRSWISRGSAYACLTLTLIQIPWVSQFYGNNTSLLCWSTLDEVIHIVGSGSPQTKNRWMTFFRWPCTSRTVFGVHLNVSFAKTAHARHGIRWRSGNAAWLVRRDYECAYLNKKSNVLLSSECYPSGSSSWPGGPDTLRLAQFGHNGSFSRGWLSQFYYGSNSDWWPIFAGSDQIQLPALHIKSFQLYKIAGHIYIGMNGREWGCIWVGMYKSCCCCHSGTTAEQKRWWLYKNGW